MNINEMTIEEFRKLPHRQWNEEIICDSIVVLPGEEIHDSGYRCMDFVAIVQQEPVCLLAGGSDVLHFDGIGGYGYNWLSKYNATPTLVPPSGWNMDCLKISGLLHIFCHGKGIRCGSALSSFDIHTCDNKVPPHIPKQQRVKYKKGLIEKEI